MQQKKEIAEHIYQETLIVLKTHIHRLGRPLTQQDYAEVRRNNPGLLCRRSLEYRTGLAFHEIGQRLLRNEDVVIGDLPIKENKDTPRQRVSSPESHSEPVDKKHIERKMSGKEGEVTVESLNIKTIEDALAVAEIDLNYWVVERSSINSWEVTMGAKAAGSDKPQKYTNWQVKVWLKKREDKPIFEAIDNLMQRVQEKAPNYPRITTRCNDDMAVELGLVDAHIGMLAWKAEVGEDYDLKIGIRDYRQTAEKLLELSSHYSPKEIWLPLGNDFFHLNNPRNQTPKSGAELDVDTRLVKIFEAGLESMIKIVEMCASLAPVQVVWVPGNHDPETSYYLTRTLKAYFHNSDRIVIDASPAFRKYIRFGTNLIGLTHGSDEPMQALPNIMAGERPQDWAETTYREWHIGHGHHKKEMHFVGTDTYNGVVIRMLPSLSGLDFWHYQQGYSPRYRAAEAHLWSKESGYVGHLLSSVPRNQPDPT